MCCCISGAFEGRLSARERNGRAPCAGRGPAARAAGRSLSRLWPGASSRAASTGCGVGVGVGCGCGNGYGNGCGHGSGCGYGFGSGNGFGNGSGNGSGSGSGNGSGNGSGLGNGHGSGHGNGNGSGSASGHGCVAVQPLRGNFPSSTNRSAICSSGSAPSSSLPRRSARVRPSASFAPMTARYG